MYLSQTAYKKSFYLPPISFLSRDIKHLSTNSKMTGTIPKEQKALITSEDLKPIVSTIPVSTPSDDQILIRAKAFALNPLDGKLVEYLKVTNSVIGCDVSGVVVQVGKNVKGFKVGTNVSAMCRGASKPYPYSAAFSEYVVAYPHATYQYKYDLKLSNKDKIPAGPIDTYEGAASLSTSLATAGMSLFQVLGLRKGEEYSNETILIWSGATATGLIAVQVAKWLGFKNIVVTASKIRFDLLKSLGATALYDYKDSDVVSKIKKDFGDDIVYGFDSFSSKETFSNTYLALSNTKPVHICNLSGMDEETLTVPLKTNKVEFGLTQVFLALGESKPVPENFQKFQQDVQSFLDERKIKNIPLTVLPNGLEGLIEGILVLLSGKYGAEKFVARL